MSRHFNRGGFCSRLFLFEGARLFDITDRGLQRLCVVAEAAEPHVAPVAQKPANRHRSVAVVDVRFDGGRVQGPCAYGTTTALAYKPSIKLLSADAVFSEYHPKIPASRAIRVFRIRAKQRFAFGSRIVLAHIFAHVRSTLLGVSILGSHAKPIGAIYAKGLRAHGGSDLVDMSGGSIGVSSPSGSAPSVGFCPGSGIG